MPAPRTYLLDEIATHLNGDVLGEGNPRIIGIATLRRAGPAELSFFTNARYRAELDATRAGAVLLGRNDRDACERPRIICADPYLAYAKAVALLHPAPVPVPGTHSSASVDPTAQIGNGTQIGASSVIGRGAVIGEQVIIGPGCVIGENARIGSGSLLHGNVTVYADVKIGQRAIVHSGAVLGADGFGMAKDGEGWCKIRQIGAVVIGNDVEIGANTTVDRGALDDTVIEDGVKLDNQIQIGHNVHIGAHSAFAGCVGIAGSARIGRRCTIGGGSIVLGHLEIADDVHIGAASVVTKSIIQAGEYTGLYPIQEKAVWARNAALLRNLGKLDQRLRELEAKLERGKINVENGG